MGRSQKDDALQQRQPAGCGRLAGAVHCAARDQPAHAVRHDSNLLQRDRPVRHHLLQLLCQQVPVLRGVQAGVVAHVHRGVAQGCQCGAVVDRGAVVSLAVPLQVVHAQAVDQQRHLVGCARQLRRAAPQQGTALVTQGHGRGQRVVALGQPVAHHAIEGGQHGFALRCFGRGIHDGGQQRLQLGQARLQPFAHQFGDAVDRAVDKAGNAAGFLWRAAGNPHAAPDRLVHAFCDAGYAPRGLGGQLGYAAQVAGP